MVNKFTQKAQNALSTAQRLAEELGHCYIGTEHLLLGLLAQKESIASRILVLRGVNEARLRKSIIDCTGIGTHSEVNSRDMTPRLRQIIESAAKEAEQCGIRYVGTEHLLCAILNKKDCVGLRLLELQGVSVIDIKTDLSAYLGSAPYKQKESMKVDDAAKSGKRSPLLSFGRDLTELARGGATDPVLCREDESERIIRILCRRTKNNPCLIGEPGVGKTAVVEGLARRIAMGDVPSDLTDKRIITLDISSMLAGAKFRGEFEDRIRGVIDAAKKDPSIILFVDEMHIMVGAGAAEGAIDASNILKPALARGEIRMIGATTPTEYRAHIEKDAAFERRFQPVMLEEPSEDQCISILRGLRDRYESYHGIRISDEAISEAVRLSSRYIHDRFLPDKAIDLIDEAAAKLRLNSTRATHTAGFGEEGSAALSSALSKRDIEQAMRISAEQRALQGSAWQTAVQTSTDVAVLTPSLIADVVSEQTGIPCNSLMISGGDKLCELENRLKEKIIGQDQAISAVSTSIKRGRSGLCASLRPTGSFLFLGDSGVGKTALCKELAALLFDSRDALVRLDMSEYMEKHSVSKLIGSPPGYVGYGEGGLLTERIRRRPYSVILLDEIEKAHPDVLHLLLQILEDGRLTDSAGRSVSFSNTVIVMTSNLISSREINHRSLGFGENDSSATDLRSHPRLKEIFSTELLGRIDGIILFNTLGKEELSNIAEIMLSELRKRAESIDLKLIFDPSVTQRLTNDCLSLKQNEGARPLRRSIAEHIEGPLADALISGEIRSGQSVLIGTEAGVITLSPK